MAVHALSRHFDSFFKHINPSRSFELTAAREHKRITELLENPFGPAGDLGIRCFLQGSYRQETAIHSINDVDIVALCELWQPGSSGGGGGTSWSRDDIFDAVAHAVAADRALAPYVKYGPQSMVVKVLLDIKVEVLPVVFKAGNFDADVEPFRLYRPDRAEWDDGFARDHQALLSRKNAPMATRGNFKPMIKVLKHIRDRFEQPAVSFHLECLLYSLPNSAFLGAPADYVGQVLASIAERDADDWYSQFLWTPCRDRDIFTSAEWDRASWRSFHRSVVEWAEVAGIASETDDRALAIRAWRALLGNEWFPARTPA